MFRQTDESRIQICKVCTREAGPPLRIHPPRRTCRICPSASPRVDVFNLLSRAAAHVNLDIYSLTACKLRERGISSSVSASRACPKFRLLRESGKRRGKNEREKDLCVHFFFPSTRAHSCLEKYLWICIEYSYTQDYWCNFVVWNTFFFFFLILMSNVFLIKRRKIIFTK